MSEFGEDLEESSLFNYLSILVCVVSEAEGIAFIFIMAFN